MSSTNDTTTPSLNFQAILSAALANYSNQTGKDLENDPLAAEIRQCESPDHILTIFKKQAQKFDEFRNGDSKLMKYLNPIIDGLHALSNNAALSAGVSLVFPPAQIILSGISVLLTAAKGVRDGYDTLLEVLECIDNFLMRLKTYTQSEIGLVLAMAEILVKIVAEFLCVLALATKWMNEGRIKKFAKKLLGDNDVQAVLRRLDRLTQEESRATAVQSLEVIYGLVNNMAVVMEDGKASTEGIRQALVLMQQAVEKINQTSRDQLQKDLRTWLSPPDPSTNHNIARKSHHSGTAMWFIQGDTFKEWKTTGSLLWVHGNPGSGKSVLCSTIIQDALDLREAGLATVAYFYFNFGDAAKQDAHGLLSSLLIQLCVQSDSFCDILSAIYSKHDRGFRQPSDDVLLQCLKELVAIPGQGPLYIVIDALDECPNPSGLTSPRKEVLNIMRELVKLRLPHLHLSITSRPETDIQAVLEPLSTHAVSLHDQTGQAQDIAMYVNSVVLSHPTMREWPDYVQKLVINTLKRTGGGMFRWAYCQLEILCECPLQEIEGALKELPETLDGTYQRILRNIDKKKQEYAHRIFQCLAVSIRPLRVEEVAEIFVIKVNVEKTGIPEFNAGWRYKNAEDAVRSTCSTLITIVNNWGRKVVQFSHFSVKEYLMSPRLANSNDVSHFHIHLQPAHTFLARACLCILLQLDDRIDETRIGELPLATYAAEHWVDHAQFENVSSRIRDGMGSLFDRDKPHFAAWIWLHDPDKNPWKSDMFSSFPEQPEAPPLYYAALCGFHDITQQLVSTHPQDVHARGGNRTTPLHAAVDNGHMKVTLFLLDHGADVNARDYLDATPLHLASRHGDAMVVRSLIDRGADPNAEDRRKVTPLLNASEHGRLEAAQLLLEHSADMNHWDVDTWTPLERASLRGHYDIAQLFLNHGANPNKQAGPGGTPLHFASDSGHAEVAQLLLDRGAGVNAQNTNLQTPLHLAAYRGRLQVAKVLLEHGADLHIQNKEGKTPFQVASERGHNELAQLLSERASEGT